MGVTRLTWKEIDAWLEVRKKKQELELVWWEIDLVKKMSEEYCGEYHAASEPNRQAPYIVEDLSEIDRPALGNKFKNILSAFKKNAPTPKYEEEE